MLPRDAVNVRELKSIARRTNQEVPGLDNLRTVNHNKRHRTGAVRTVVGGFKVDGSKSPSSGYHILSVTKTESVE